MAYCKKCGAYIPDGQSRCLACGYDETAEAKKAEKKTNRSEGHAYAFDNEELKAQLEKQRQAQKERSRKWAEEEQARRQAQKAQQEQQARRQAQKAERYVNRGSTADTGRQRPTAVNNKVWAALSYLSVLFILPYLLCPDDGFARFHAKQGLVLFVFGVLADIVGAIIPIGWVFTLFRIFCIYKGMTNASAGREEPLPYIGRFALR